MNNTHFKATPNSFTFTKLVFFGLIALFGIAGCGGGGGSDDGGGNDNAPSLTVSSPAVVEGDSGTVELTFTVTLSEAASDDLTADYTTSDDTATAGEDYTAVNGQISIAAKI